MISRRNSIYFLFFLFFISCGEKYIHKPTRVEVHFKVEQNMFPGHWRTEEIKPYAKSLSRSLRFEAMDIIQEAFDKYPLPVIQKSLKKIYVLDDLRFYGLNYGGTSSNETVYLVHQYYTKEYVERTFHHEFGAILMHKYSFDSIAFKLLLPEGVFYGSGGLEALREGKSSLHINYELIEKGFLNEYGSSCVEEDFCTIVEQLFLPEESFWEIYDTYPVIHNKIKYIIDFYSTIDTLFKEEYFRSFDKIDIVAEKN